MHPKKLLVLLLIISLAAALRLLHLGQVPPSLDWDEASLGWNAWSLYKTGTDEYGKALPVSIRSFNDYKPPLYVYATIPSVAIFGLNEFSVRLPSAIAGILTVVTTYLLLRELTRSTQLTQLTTLLLALSPWHIQFSRVAFEANLALFFFVLGATFLVFFLNRRSAFHLLFSSFSFVAAIYSYHSSRVMVPVFLLGISIYYLRSFLPHWKSLLLTAVLLLISLYPLYRNNLHTGSLSARYTTVASNLSAATFVRNYLRNFDLNFLFVTSDNQDRHHAPDVGLLYFWELPVFLAGLFFLFRDKPKFLPFLLIWFFSAPTAAAFGNDSPHAVRSLLFLPTFQIITAYGLLKVSGRKFLVSLVCLLISVNLYFYLHQYFIHLPMEFAKSWQYGYKQVVQKVLTNESRYDRVYITSAYDQPYIYFLFYGRISPIVKNNTFFYSGFDKYEFDTSKNDKSGLYVLAPTDKLANFTPRDRVFFPDGTTAFELGTVK